jgi:amino acid adenylation domain-containing protein
MNVAASQAHGLASVQQVIWLDQLLNPDVPLYNLGILWDIVGELDVALLEAAIQAATDAHDALRLVLAEEAGVAVQRVLPRLEVAVHRVDLSEYPDAEERARAYFRQLGATRFELYGAPLWDEHLVRLGPTRVWWGHRTHHLISDGASMAIFSEAVLQSYERGLADSPAAAAPSYLELLAKDRDYLASPRFAADQEYWRQRFAELPPPLFRVGDAETRHGAAPSGRVWWPIDAARLARVKQLAAGRGCTVQHFFHALLALYFARVQGVEDIVFGVPVHNRSTGRDKRTLGMFSSMIPVRIQVDLEGSFGELMRAVASELRRSYRHQRFPLAELNRVVQLARLGRGQLFDVTVAPEVYPPRRQLGGATFTADKIYSGHEQTPLAVCLRDWVGADDTVIELDYNTRAFTHGEVEAVQRRLQRMMDAVLVDGDDQRNARVPLLDDAERSLVVERWNATAEPYPRGVCVHGLIEAQVARTPEVVAVVDGERRVSYRELNARANQLAAHLRELGVGPDVRVGLCLERSAEMVVGLLATLKAGGCYVPLDPDYPPDRVREMLADAAPQVVVSDDAGDRVLAELAGGAARLRLHVTRDAARWATAPAHDVLAGDGADRQLAYVIYTSGSTGRSKGVMNEHRGVVNRLLWMQQAYRLAAHDVVIQKTPFSFDVSVWELFWPLIAGAQLVMAQPGGHRDPGYLSELIQRAGVTTLHFVPPMLREFLAHDAARRCTSVARVVCSGEALPAALVRRFEAVLPWAELHNLYGPTEAAVDVTAWECSAWDAHGNPRTTIPIGRPIANTQIYIVDPRLQPVPVGATGEICIGGVQVARGYLNQPALTAERFVEDPFTPGQRMYRSGDLGRWLPDGTVEYLGRNDSQVKLRGFRIELGEIEARLAQVIGVRELAVIAREDVPGDRRLVAYYAGDDDPAVVDAMREHARRGLPAYMVPAAYVQVAALPVTANGKLDRKALPRPELDASARRSYEAPDSEAERQLAAMWVDVLQVERVGRHDNFFELGGHSLLAVRLIERMRRAQLHADVRVVFTAPTLAALAAVVTMRSDEVPVPANRIPRDAARITPDMLPLVQLGQDAIDAVVATIEGGPANVQDIYPLAPLQDGILFHYLMQQVGDLYLMAGVFGFASKPRLDRFVAALQQVVDRHDILRTAIAWDGLDQPVQVVCRRATLPVSQVELDGAGDAVAQLEARFDPRRHRLDIRRAPLVSCHVAHDRGHDRWLLRILFHHLTVDHTTLETVLQEARAIEDGRLDELESPAPFRDLVAQARGRVTAQDHAAFFTRMLGDLEQPTHPFGLANVHGDGSATAEARRRLPAALSRAVRVRTRALGVSAASAMHLAWALVLARTTGQSEVVFGTVLFGRMQGGARSDRALGLFINTLPVRVRVGDDGVAQALRACHALLVELLRHEHAPLSLAQRCSGIVGRTPLFTSLLNYRFSTPDAGRAPLQHVLGDEIALLSGHERTHYALALAVDDLEGDFDLTAQVNGAIAPERVCELMQIALEQVVAALGEEPDRPVGRLDVLPPAERAQLVATAGVPAARAGSGGEVALYLPALFEAQVARSPDAIAVDDGGEQLTFRELNARANQLAHYLRANGVGPDRLVPLIVERSAPMVVAVLGVLKAGGAYVPLDPNYPTERLAYLLDDASPIHVLSQAALADSLPASYVPMTLLDEQWDEIAAHPATNPDHSAAASDQLAYMIYTSGSTGQPKGVLVEHRNVGNLWAGLERAVFDHHPACQRVSLNAPLAFDASVQQWVQLLSGRTVVIVPAEVRTDGAALRQFLADRAIDVFDCTPSQLAMHAAADAAADRPAPAVTLVGGEAISSELWQALAATPGQTFYNVYGPTEATVDATVGLVTAGVAPHLGRPIANTTIYILDDQLRPAPLGVAGELYIGGAGVARGYHRRPELTTDRFLADPFAPGGRLYKTGDRGRWLPDGTIEFLGRNDFQIKLRGFRIELGEIEAELAQVIGVREVVVVAREDVPGDQRLVAYYTEVASERSERDADEVTRDEVGAAQVVGAEALRQHASLNLPPYMVPAAYVRLAALPLTQHGKLDRRALPAPESEAYARGAYEPPLGEVEEALARIWGEVLQVERIGRHDNFFDLGGHSLLVVQLVSRLRRALDVEIALSDVFERPVLADMANGVRCAGRSTLESIAVVDRAGPLALSLAQQRLWFLTQLGGASEAYHISGGLRLAGPLDHELLARALARIVARHEALRTCFRHVDGEPAQIVLPDRELVLHRRDLRGDPDPAAAARRMSDEHATARFALERDLPVRALLLQLADADHVLHIAMHHIASDGWSVGVLLDELCRLYRAYAAGEPDPLPALALQYADYAAWQRGFLAGGALEAQGAFWRANLAGAPSVLDLPTDRARPAEQDHAGGSVAVALSAELTAQLRAVSQRHGVTLYMTVLASWAAVLGRLANQDEVVVGSPVSGRNRTEVEPLIGFFVNSLALRINLAGAPTVEHLLARTRAQVLAAQAHQDLPFDQVVELVKPPRSLAHSPVFQVMLDWNTQAPKLALPGLALSVVDAELTTAQFDLSLALGDAGDRLTGALSYATALFDRETVVRYAGYWQQLLAAMAADDGQPVSRLPLLSPAERYALLVGWNATLRDHGALKFVHERISGHARRRPDHVAIDDGAIRLSYRELNRRANQLAHYLRAHGVVPDGRVALCAPRGAAMVVGLLAIMKAGGAYVPLDVTYPGERIAYMVHDSAPVVVLTVGAEARGLASVHAERAAVLDVEADAARWQDQPQTDPSPATVGLRASHLAYVIYTSGSTGAPKGVMIEHGSLLNYTRDAERWFDLSKDDLVLQQNSLNFDLSLEEILPALAAGACLAPSERPFGMAASDGRRPTMVHLTAAHWHSLVGAWSEAGGAGGALDGVRMINVTGDAVSPHKLVQWEAVCGDTRLINTYGPTEVTVSCSAAYVRHEPGASRVSIGKPFANTRMYVLDRHGAPAPIGVVGELYLSGAGVGRGYLNLPALTAARFVDDPFWPGQRMYRSGDLARWRPDGQLELIGRDDHQVKVRGFRIELGDVESRLAVHGGVQDVVVIAREDTPGDKRLVAYYTGDQPPLPDELRQHAAHHLPGYMVPSAYVHLAALPVTPNGKLDRAALPAPDSESCASQVYEAPRGDLEHTIARIWAALLKIERVGRHDDFFELGGHSLLAIRVIECLRRDGLYVDVRALFMAPTVAELATQVAASPSAREVLVPPNLIVTAASDELLDAEAEELRL